MSDNVAPHEPSQRNRNTNIRSLSVVSNSDSLLDTSHALRTRTLLSNQEKLELGGTWNLSIGYFELLV